MAVMFKSSGVILFKSSGVIAMDPSCCCDTPPPASTCNDCFSTAESGESFTVDMGAGGLTDNLCSYCDQIAGDFNCTWLSGCRWLYNLSPACVFSCTAQTPGCQNAAKTFTILLELAVASGKCVWEAVASLSYATDDTCNGTTRCRATATYRSPVDAPNVREGTTSGPWILERISQSVGDLVCSGSFPATITVTRN